MRSPDDLRVVASPVRTERSRVYARTGTVHTYYAAIDALDDGTFEARVWEYRSHPEDLYRTKHFAVFDTFDEALQGITGAYLLGITGSDLPHIDRPYKRR